MSKYICNIEGARGRSIKIYDNKCVITTNVTLGSVLTNNATDGEKTIFYVDVTGVQFKEHGLTLGYLQLETASSQMNNQSSNFFSENTFTFDSQNDYMRRVCEFIIARIEGYKYGTISEAPTEIPDFTERERSMIERREQEKALSDEYMKQKELERQESEEHLKTLVEQLQQSNPNEENFIFSFANQVKNCSSMTEILKLWQTIPDDIQQDYSHIGNKIQISANTERLYGKDQKVIDQFIGWMHDLFQ